MTEQEQVDAWWSRLTRSERLDVLSTHWEGGDPLIQPNAWWHSHDRERTVRIWRAETGGQT